MGGAGHGGEIHDGGGTFERVEGAEGSIQPGAVRWHPVPKPADRSVACSTSSRDSMRNCSRNSFMRAAPQNIAMKLTQHFWRDRLDQIKIRPACRAASRSCGRGLGAGDQSGDGGGLGWQPAQGAQEGQPVHFRHVDVDDQQIGWVEQKFFQSLDAVQRFLDDVSGLLDRIAVIQPDQAGIIDDQNTRRVASQPFFTSMGRR